jgi:chromosome partitioning protein
MYESNTRLASEVKADVDTFFRQIQDPTCPWANAQTFQTTIRRNIRLAEAPSFGQSIFEYAAQSHGATDYELLAREVLGLPIQAPSAASSLARNS